MNQYLKAQTTTALSFGNLSAGIGLFSVQDGLSTRLALEHASRMFACAGDLLGEIGDADPQLARKLGQAALHFIDAGKALTEASAQGMLMPVNENTDKSPA